MKKVKDDTLDDMKAIRISRYWQKKSIYCAFCTDPNYLHGSRRHLDYFPSNRAYDVTTFVINRGTR